MSLLGSTGALIMSGVVSAGTRECLTQMVTFFDGTMIDSTGVTR